MLNIKKWGCYMEEDQPPLEFSPKNYNQNLMKQLKGNRL